MPSNRKRIDAGRRTFRFYCSLKNLSKVEQDQDYTVADLVADVLHFAAYEAFDPEAIIRMATTHFEAESIEPCPKCGKRVTREDAYTDEGADDEAGRTFYYCSERCRETH